MTVRFDDSLDAAHAAAYDALRLDCAKMDVPLGNTPPRVRRVIERDIEGRSPPLSTSQPQVDPWGPNAQPGTGRFMKK